MHKAEIHQFLKKQKIWHEITEHNAVFSMTELRNVAPGSVSPFGLLNDAECKVKWFYDADFAKSKKQIIGIHPNDNTATTWL